MVARRVRHFPVAVCLVVLTAVACEKVPLLAPSGSTIVLTTPTNVLAANGEADVTAQVLESSGTPPHSGTRVNFTTTLGSLSPAQAETDASGLVTVKFLPGSNNGTATISATSGGAATGTNGALKILIGTAAVGGVRMSCSPCNVPASGGATTVTVNVFDINGNALPSATVNLATSAGTLGSTLIQTNSSGVASTTLTTSQTATVTANVGAQGASTGTGSGTTPGTGTGGTGSSSGTTPTTGQASASVTVTVIAAPTLLITPPSTPPNAGVPSTYTFAVTAATGGVAVRDVSVDWGGGTPRTQDLGSFTGSQVVAHTYNSPGTYTIVGTISDAAGNSNVTSTSVGVISLASPTINITPSVPSTCTGSSATCSVSVQLQVTPPTGLGVQSASINWGDGTSQDLGGVNGTITLSHTYTGHGPFTITVTVVDTTGRSTSGSNTVVIP